MTALDTAKEIYSQYLYIEDNFNETLLCDKCNYNRNLAKYSSIIAVDLIIKNTKIIFGEENRSFNYWHQVKNILQKL